MDRAGYERLAHVLCAVIAGVAVAVLVLCNAPALVVFPPAMLLGSALERLIHQRAERLWDVERQAMDAMRDALLEDRRILLADKTRRDTEDRERALRDHSGH